MSSIGTDCIYERERPDLSGVSDSELMQILIAHDSEWININRLHDDMIKRIFKIWAEQEILDHTNNPITCTICYDTLTNGDNMTYPCGHQFHSTCAMRGILIRCAEKFTSGLNNKDSPQIELDCLCAQCNVKIDSYSVNKQDIIKYE